MAEKLTGGCQCGDIRYEVSGEAQQVVACHCTDCQTQSGSAFGMTLVVKEENFKLTKGEVKGFTSKSAADRDKLGAFCPACGTRIYHKVEARPGKLAVKPGTLDDTSILKPSVHLWTSSKQSWVTIPDDAEAYEKQPF
ncbi:MAG: GFA family protein [Rhodospirillales bacterium]|nr:GFA family protein [Rhodospirillales bacterium]